MQKNSKINSLLDKVNKCIGRVDAIPLWWIGILLLGVAFLPYMILGEGSVFEIHDQLDETLLTYVLQARHLGDKAAVLPELLGGINSSGMQPSAVLFILLYFFLPAFWAFVVQYFIVCACGFFGMYFSVKRLSGSSILGVLAAGCFCMLPVQPIYGLSVLGVPLLLYAFLCLYDKKHLVVSFCLILLFGVTTHLVLIGYIVLCFWALYLLYMLWKRKNNVFLYAGFALLLTVYVLVNWNLFWELLAGGGDYISHREELVNYGGAVWENSKRVFLESSQHAVSLHKYLLVPILVILVWEGATYGRKTAKEKESFWLAVAVLLVLVLIACFYGICKSTLIADWKNRQTGFLRYFQLERFYWIYPAGWYLEMALVFNLWWQKKAAKWWNCQVSRLAVFLLLLLPTVNLIKENSYFYMNVNQINNGSGITGYVTWENYYAKDLMEQIEKAIGRDMTTYRVAHLGISPAPSLMHGFYTVDGYSNNYPLEYKHRFRQVIAKELEKNEAMRLYFDEWGSRCYLFNHVTGNYWSVEKGSGVQYSDLDFDMEALKGLGCEYVFSGGEILQPESLGLEMLGYFETEKSYWGIWVYRVL